MISQTRRRRVVIVVVSALLIVFLGFLQDEPTPKQPQTPPSATNNTAQNNAQTALEELAVKGRAPKTNYSRDQFGGGWRESGGCSTRDQILKRDLTKPILDGCVVLAGNLQDPYTNKIIQFSKGRQTSAKVQIDHVVALSDAWQKGAQALSPEQRETLANDPLELLAVDGQANQDKGGSDAASWLPPNKKYRCRYVTRQIAVKRKYSLWVSSPEKSAMVAVLRQCPSQQLPRET